MNKNTKDLKKLLMIERKNAGKILDEEQIKKAFEFCDGYKDFLNKCKTERELTKVTIEMAKKRGFEEFDNNKKYKAGDKVFCNNRGKGLILAVIGKNGVKDGADIIISHSDSPRLDLKPYPLYEDNELALLKTRYYGGLKKYLWSAIPLSLHGTVVLKDGTKKDIIIGEQDDEPKFCITDLIIHLSKKQMDLKVREVVKGEDMNILIGSLPIKSDEKDNCVKLNILKILNEKYGIIEKDFTTAEFEIVPAFKAVDVGIDCSMVGSYGHDDRVCAYTSIMGILNCDEPQKTAIVIVSDKEETGSDGNTGAKSEYYKNFIEDLADADDVKLRNCLSKSKCISADVSAAFDPNWPEPYESLNSSFLNYGVAINKYVGGSGKGSTSDASAEFMAETIKLLEENNILYHISELGKVDAGGGGTIAVILANLNVDVVDLGVSVLSMHSPFEIVSKIDVYMAYKTYNKFLK